MNRVWRDTKLAIAGLGQLGSVIFKRKRPFILNHIITVRCNLDCPFCYVSGPDQQEYNREHYPKGEELTTEELLAFYRALIALKFRLSVIVGGEPIMRRDLADVLALCQGHIFTTVFSNGLLLAERHEILRKAASVIVSLDAPDAQHDQLRNREGAFEKAMAGIEAMRHNHPKTVVCIMMTVIKQNVERVEDMLRFARENRLAIGFQPPTYDGQFSLEGRPVTDPDSAMPDPEPLSEAFCLIKEASRRQAVLASTEFFDHVIEDRKTYPCQYPAYVLGPVYPNGDVLGCTHKTMIGNVRQTGVGTVLASEAFRGNADAGVSCPVGCRDWGIHDISALHNRTMKLGELGRYTRTFIRT